MPLSESLLTGLFMMLVVFAVLIILMALIKLFTGVIAGLSRADTDGSHAEPSDRG
ncbi:MAG: OadG family protein [Oscillospiraceae bacterium]|jgi:hypothetical protein|nr:OadG family protein [Oscillospiraceae bacterium]